MWFQYPQGAKHNHLHEDASELKGQGVDLRWRASVRVCWDCCQTPMRELSLVLREVYKKTIKLNAVDKVGWQRQGLGVLMRPLG